MQSVSCGVAMRNPEKYVHDCHRKDAYLRAYNHITYPMNGQELWVKTGNKPILLPVYSKMPGRPRKMRIREPDELPKSPTKLRKYQTSVKCRQCGEVGHNMRTCKGELQQGKVAPCKPITNNGKGERTPATKCVKGPIAASNARPIAQGVKGPNATGVRGPVAAGFRGPTQGC
ncbi:unnamed protein product [Camellia sinensis]